MSAQIIDGKAVASEIKQQVKQSLSELLSKDMRVPVLAVVLVGEDPASEVYVGHKKRACTEVGIGSITHQLPAETTEQQLLTLIHNLNNDVNVDGILVQLPLPDHLDSTLVINSIRPDKDVDGFHPENVGKLALRMPGIRSCTPYGVIKLLDSVGQKYKGEHAVVVGASNIVGRPMMLELLLAGATVTICHRFTPNTPELVRQADIVVVAVGVPGFLKGDWVKPGATIIDVGINRLEDGSLSGDVDYTAAAEKAAYITPVPGGVGPMTVAMLMHNTLKAYQVRMAASPSE